MGWTKAAALYCTQSLERNEYSDVECSALGSVPMTRRIRDALCILSNFLDTTVSSVRGLIYAVVHVSS
jgi:hypothetical protein